MTARTGCDISGGSAGALVFARGHCYAWISGLDQWIPLAFRETLANAVSRQAIAIERCVLAEGTIASADAREHLLYRWQATSPLYRAASAVITDWETRGIDPCQGHLHGRDIRDRDTPYFAGFSLRYFNAIPTCLTE